MSLEHILLTFLDRPTSGYDLKREFEAGAATFWPAQLSQIYPTLKRLEERGLLRSASEASNKGPDRRTYVRTETGTQELERWLRSDPQVGRERFAYLGQLSAMAQLGDPEATSSFLIRLRQAFAERLDYLEQFESVILGEDTPELVDERSFYDWAALRMGTTGLQARISCCDELIGIIERRTEASARPGRQQAKKGTAR